MEYLNEVYNCIYYSTIACILIFFKHSNLCVKAQISPWETLRDEIIENWPKWRQEENQTVRKLQIITATWYENDTRTETVNTLLYINCVWRREAQLEVVN